MQELTPIRRLSRRTLIAPAWTSRHRAVLSTLDPRLDHGVAGAGDLLSASARDLKPALIHVDHSALRLLAPHPPSDGLKTVPSSATTRPMPPPSRPSRSGQWTTMTCRPGANVIPLIAGMRCRSAGGAAPSKTHCLPAPSLMNSSVCGLL